MMMFAGGCAELRKTLIVGPQSVTVRVGAAWYGNAWYGAGWCHGNLRYPPLRNSRPKIRALFLGGG